MIWKTNCVTASIFLLSLKSSPPLPPPFLWNLATIINYFLPRISEFSNFLWLIARENSLSSWAIDNFWPIDFYRCDFLINPLINRCTFTKRNEKQRSTIENSKRGGGNFLEILSLRIFFNFVVQNENYDEIIIPLVSCRDKWNTKMWNYTRWYKQTSLCKFDFASLNKDRRAHWNEFFTFKCERISRIFTLEYVHSDDVILFTACQKSNSHQTLRE